MAASSNDDWRSEWNGILSVLDKARKEARFTDVQFVMDTGTLKHKFHAHKNILACGSPVFEKMFYGGLAEKRSVIETDDDPEAFEILLNYIYGKSNNLISLTSAGKFFIIGDKYLVPKTQDVAKEYIKSVSLTEDAFWNVIQENSFSNPLFREKIDSYMIENTEKLIESKNFLSVPEIIVDNLLQMNKLNIQEYQLLLAVTIWGYVNEQANSKDLLKFYKHIRFSTLTSNEFFQFIEVYPEAIDAKSSLEILQHLHNPSSHNLPKWCSTSKVSRNTEFQKLYEKIYANRRYLNDSDEDLSVALAL